MPYNSPEKRKAYYQKNKAKIAEKSAAYYQKNKDDIKKTVRRHYQTNKEEINSERRRKHSENPEPKRARDKVYREKNRDKINTSQRSPEKRQRKNDKRRENYKENPRGVIEYNQSKNKGWESKINRGKIWDYEEDLFLVMTEFEDAVIAKKLERSVFAVRARRYILRKQGRFKVPPV